MYLRSSRNNNDNNLFNCSPTATPAWLEEGELDASPDGNSGLCVHRGSIQQLRYNSGVGGSVGWEVDLEDGFKL